MRILYIDTSSSYLYSGIVEDEKLLVEIKKDFGLDLSEVALPEIAKLFKKAKLEPNQIDKIIVVDGPGSFTGVRVGITIAKIYAWSLNIPISTISSLDAMMISCPRERFRKIPVLDARRGFCYAAMYDRRDITELEPQYIKIDDLEDLCSFYEEYTIITNDKIKIKDVGIRDKYDPNILKIVNFYKDKEVVNPHAVNPRYLKLTAAEENRFKW